MLQASETWGPFSGPGVTEQTRSAQGYRFSPQGRRSARKHRVCSRVQVLHRSCPGPGVTEQTGHVTCCKHQRHGAVFPEQTESQNRRGMLKGTDSHLKGTGLLEGTGSAQGYRFCTGLFPGPGVTEQTGHVSCCKHRRHGALFPTGPSCAPNSSVNVSSPQSWRPWWSAAAGPS